MGRKTLFFSSLKTIIKSQNTNFAHILTFYSTLKIWCNKSGKTLYKLYSFIYLGIPSYITRTISYPTISLLASGLFPYYIHCELRCHINGGTGNNSIGWWYFFWVNLRRGINKSNGRTIFLFCKDSPCYLLEWLY